MKKLYDEIVQTLYNNHVLFSQKGLVPPATVAFIEEQPLDLHAAAFTAPALFIDYKIEWKRHGKDIREGQVTLDCHLLLENYSVTGAIDNPIEKNVKRIDYYDLVKMLVEDIYVDETNRLGLESEEFLWNSARRYRRFRFSSLISRKIIHNYIPVSGVKMDIKEHSMKL